jgi:hypothetical protein
MSRTPEDDRMVFTQYRAFGQHYTTVTCAKHERELLAALRKAGIGSGSSFAPSLARCDRCENAKEAQQ